MDKASFRLTGAPARVPWPEGVGEWMLEGPELPSSRPEVNAALSLLAFDPRPGRWSLPEGRLNETELKAHYANLSFSLEDEG